ncbi:MAG: penicillin-binding protein, partial [Bacilli bacterium]|nr:penicillin-binding protein [Bacilli bacterium]
MSSKQAIRNLQGVFLLLFLILFINILYISISGNHLVSGKNIRAWAKQRGLQTIKVNANRGTIFDRNGEIIAKDSYTYTIIAYLDKARYDELNDKPAYIVDKKLTATKLAPIIKSSETKILEYLNKPKLYQTYLGAKGKGLSLEQKEA